MQVGAPAGQPAARVGHDDAVPRDHPQQIGRVGPLPAPDAGADRAAQAGSPAAAAGSRGSSGWMSIRQPVSRAARRAFCPSLPIASDSW
jgi:hypothetical protein